MVQKLKFDNDRSDHLLGNDSQIPLELGYKSCELADGFWSDCQCEMWMQLKMLMVSRGVFV